MTKLEYFKNNKNFYQKPFSGRKSGSIELGVKSRQECHFPRLRQKSPDLDKTLEAKRIQKINQINHKEVKHFFHVMKINADARKLYGASNLKEIKRCTRHALQEKNSLFTRVLAVRCHLRPEEFIALSLVAQKSSCVDWQKDTLWKVHLLTAMNKIERYAPLKNQEIFERFGAPVTMFSQLTREDRREEAVRIFRSDAQVKAFAQRQERNFKKEAFSTDKQKNAQLHRDISQAPHALLKQPEAVFAMLFYGITLKEAVAARIYTTGHYHAINQALRKDTIASTPVLAEISSTFSACLKKLPPSQAAVVYRAIDLYSFHDPETGQDVPSQLHQEFVVGSAYREKGFTSTSQSEELVKQFGQKDTLLVITDSQHKGREVSFFTDHPEEEEVTFPIGSRFFIDQKESYNEIPFFNKIKMHVK